jgi:hypothetical protein
VLCDFRRDRLLYIESGSPENVQSLNERMTPALERQFPKLDRGAYRQVHSAIEVVPNESFLAFFYGSAACGFFCHVDYRRKRIRFVTAGDFEALSGAGPVESFGNTFDKDPTDPTCFYLSARLAPNDEHPAPRIAYYRVALDLGRADLILSRTCEPKDECPHATRRVGDRLLSSEFNVTQYQLLKSGLTFDSDDTFHDHVVRRYWAGLGATGAAGALARHILAHPFRFRKDVRKQRRARPDLSLADVAMDRCFRRTHPSRDFVRACLALEDSAFRIASGHIRVLSLTEKKEIAFPVRHSKPAHFEIGATGHVYLSCHALFSIRHRTYFLEPAAILKLRVSDDQVEEEAAFQHPKGYRFTSHKVFLSEGREYLCTMGHPNRLLLIDAEKMNLLAWRDLGEDYLSSRKDVAAYLSATNLEAPAIRAIAVSEDGLYLALGGAGAVTVVDRRSLDVVDTLPVSDTACRLAGRPAGHLACDAIHCQRLG